MQLLKNKFKKGKNQGRVIATLTGYAGTLPFIFSAIAALVIEDAYIKNLINPIIIYSYIIIVFIGAVYWRVGLNIENEKKSYKYYIYSVIPSLCCWIIYLLNLVYLVNIIFIILFLNLSLLVEKYILNINKIFYWFFLLRLKLNFIVTFSLLILLIRFLNPFLL